MKRIYLLAALFLSGAALAQTVTITATPTTGVGSVTPTVTWSTTPAAITCTASGDWSGSKAASGTQTLPAVTSNKSYTLSCDFSTTGPATITVTTPSQNTDDSPLTNLAAIRVDYGQSQTSLTQSKQFTTTTPGTALALTIQGLSTGTWYFGSYALTSTGNASSISNVVQRTIGTVTASKTASITVSPDTTPKPPVLAVLEPAAMTVKKRGSGWDLADNVGTVAIGTSCNPDQSYGNGGYYGVDPKAVSLYKGRKATRIAARCG